MRDKVPYTNQLFLQLVTIFHRLFSPNNCFLVIAIHISANIVIPLCILQADGNKKGRCRSIHPLLVIPYLIGRLPSSRALTPHVGLFLLIAGLTRDLLSRLQLAFSNCDNLSRFYSSLPFTVAKACDNRLAGPYASAHLQADATPFVGLVPSSLILIHPSILLPQLQQLLKHGQPLLLHLPGIHPFPVGLEPIEHIMLLQPMLRRVPLIRLNEGLHLIVPS